MKTMVLYESMFGNTEHVADAVGAELRVRGSTVIVAEVGTTLPSDLTRDDLLVVAAPTHALGLSSSRSRAAAVARGADQALVDGELVRAQEWGQRLARLPVTSEGAGQVGA